MPRAEAAFISVSVYLLVCARLFWAGSAGSAGGQPGSTAVLLVPTVQPAAEEGVALRGGGWRSPCFSPRCSVRPAAGRSKWAGAFMKHRELVRALPSVSMDLYELQSHGL